MCCFVKTKIFFWKSNKIENRSVYGATLDVNNYVAPYRKATK